MHHSLYEKAMNIYEHLDQIFRLLSHKSENENNGFIILLALLGILVIWLFCWRLFVLYLPTNVFLSVFVTIMDEVCVTKPLKFVRYLKKNHSFFFFRKYFVCFVI